MCGCFEWPSNKRRSQNVIDGRRVSLLRSSNWSKRDTEIPKEALISNHLCKKRGRISVFCHHYSKLWGVLLKFIVTAAVENAAEVKDVWAEGTKKTWNKYPDEAKLLFPKKDIYCSIRLQQETNIKKPQTMLRTAPNFSNSTKWGSPDESITECSTRMKMCDYYSMEIKSKFICVLPASL